MPSPVVEKKIRFDIQPEVTCDAQEPELSPHSYSQEHQQQDTFQWHQEYYPSPHSNRSSGYERDIHHSPPDHKIEEPAPNETRRPEANSRDGGYDRRFDEHWKYRDRHQDYYRDRERDRERNGNRDRDRNRDQERYHRDYSDNPRQNDPLEDRERDRERYPRDRTSTPSRWNHVSPRNTSYQLTSPGSRQGESREDVYSKGSRSRSRSASPSSPTTSLPSAADLVPRPTIVTGRLVQYRQSSSTPVSPRTVTPTTALTVSMPLALTIQDTDDATHQRTVDPTNVSTDAAMQREAVISTVTPPEAASITSSRQPSPRRDDHYREHQDYHHQYQQNLYREKFHSEHGHNMGDNHNHINKYNNHHFENRDRYRYSSNQNRSYHHRPSGPHYKPPFHRQPYREAHHRPYQSAASQQDRSHQSEASQDRSYQLAAQQEHVPAPLATHAPAISTPVLPSGWASAKDSEGRVYYYHVLTRATQWEFPTTEDPAKKQEVAMSGQPSLENLMGTRAVVHSGTEEYPRGPEYPAGYPGYPGNEMRGSDHIPLRGDHAGQVPGATWNGFDGDFRPQAKPLNERDLKAAVSI